MPVPISRRTSAALVVIVAVAAALRLFPIWFGFPDVRVRPDEETAIAHAIAVLGGDPNPHFFDWPSLTFYLLAVLYGIVSGVRHLLVVDPTMTPPILYLFGRAFVAVVGTATVYVLFTLGRRIAGSATALLASALLGVAILHVRESHFAMTDVLMTFFVVVALDWLVRALDEPPDAAIRWFAGAGVAGGLAAGTKYSAAVIVGSMAVAQIVWFWRAKRVRPRVLMPSAVFVAGFAAAFLVSTPYAVLDYPAFKAAFQFDMRHLATGHGVNVGRGWFYHLTRTLPYGAGLPTFVAAAVGVVPAMRRYPRDTAVLAGFAVPLYVSIGSGYTVFFRYALPLIPIVALFAAIAVTAAAASVARRTSLSNGVATLLLGGLVAGPALVNCVWFDALLAKTDTRVIGGRWLAQRVTADSTVYETGGYAQIDTDGVEYHRWAYDPIRNSFYDPDGATPDWLVIEESPLSAYAIVPAPLRELAREKYVFAGMIRGTKGPPTGDGGRAIYDVQDAFFMPISGFDTIDRPGPTVLFYRRADLR